MVSDNMALLHHALHEIRAGGNIIAHHKKGGGGLMFFQSVQNGGCAAILVARIEGKVDYFFSGILGIPGVIPAQFLETGIGRRRLSLLLKA